jgi:hypothetical protein
VPNLDQASQHHQLNQHRQLDQHHQPITRLKRLPRTQLSDCLLILDELAQINFKTTGDCAYMMNT